MRGLKSHSRDSRATFCGEYHWLEDSAQETPSTNSFLPRRSACSVFLKPRKLCVRKFMHRMRLQQKRHEQFDGGRLPSEQTIGRHQIRMTDKAIIIYSRVAFRSRPRGLRSTAIAVPLPRARLHTGPDGRFDNPPRIHVSILEIVRSMSLSPRSVLLTHRIILGRAQRPEWWRSLGPTSSTANLATA